MKSERLILIGATVFLLAGCAAKRQAAARIDYVTPAPSTLTSVAAEPAQLLVIEEPAPPAPAPAEAAPVEHVVPEPAPAAPVPARPKHRGTTTAPTQTSNPESPEPEEPAESEEPQVPKLAPGETSASQSAALRRQIDEVRGRMGAFDRARLSAAGQKALDDASNFVDQSKQALDAGDLIRSSNLLHKALLLMEAVEQQH